MASSCMHPTTLQHAALERAAYMAHWRASTPSSLSHPPHQPPDPTPYPHVGRCCRVGVAVRGGPGSTVGPGHQVGRQLLRVGDGPGLVLQGDHTGLQLRLVPDQLGPQGLDLPLLPPALLAQTVNLSRGRGVGGHACCCCRQCCLGFSKVGDTLRNSLMRVHHSWACSTSVARALSVFCSLDSSSSKCCVAPRPATRWACSVAYRTATKDTSTSTSTCTNHESSAMGAVT